MDAPTVEIHPARASRGRECPEITYLDANLLSLLATTISYLYICRLTGMRRSRSHSRQTQTVLAELLRVPANARYGYEIAKATGLASGTLYPILMRLEERGLLEARWELGERPRHMYRLTAEGVEVARASAVPPSLATSQHPVIA